MTSSGGGGANAASTNGTSPRFAGPTATRRRVTDLMDAFSDRTSNLSDSPSLDEEDHDLNGSVPSGGGGGTHHHLLLHQYLHHHYGHHLHHHHHPATKSYPVLRRRMFFFVPDTWLLGIEDWFYWMAAMVQSLRSGKNLGRRIFGALILMVVVSLFVKVSFLSSHVEVDTKMKENNGLLILQPFKDDSAMAQRAITEAQTSMPKRVLERFSVSKNKIFHIRNSFFFFPIKIHM